MPDVSVIHLEPRPFGGRCLAVAGVRLLGAGIEVYGVRVIEQDDGHTFVNLPWEKTDTGARRPVVRLPAALDAEVKAAVLEAYRRIAG